MRNAKHDLLESPGSKACGIAVVRRGYTLLELILALGLSAFVIAAIGSAIQLYLVALTRQQMLIERKQVARGVLEMIGNDLRAAIQYKAEDYSDLENLVQSQMLLVNQVAAPEGESSEEEPDPVVDEEAVSFRPTLLGNDKYILMDVSRLPRLDQYNPLVATAEDAVQTPSDVKSLAYFVSLTGGGMESEVDFAETNAPGGLYRRSIDRAVASYRGDTNIVSSPDEFSRLVAGEIAQLQFQYFDGEEWLSQWDSIDQGGFPTAIKITLVLDPRRTNASQNYAFNGADDESMETYISVVHLPAADPPPGDEQ